MHREITIYSIKQYLIVIATKPIKFLFSCIKYLYDISWLNLANYRRWCSGWTTRRSHWKHRWYFVTLSNGHSAILLFISAVCRESWKIMGELLKSVVFVRIKRTALTNSEQTELTMRRGWKSKWICAESAKILANANKSRKLAISAVRKSHKIQWIFGSSEQIFRFICKSNRCAQGTKVICVKNAFGSISEPGLCLTSKPKPHKLPFVYIVLLHRRRILTIANVYV